MKAIITISLLLHFILVPSRTSATVATVDFLFQPSYTNSYVWNNYVGAVLNLDEVYSYYNSTYFQGYILNSNLKGQWHNNFAYTLRMPKGWYYNCTDAAATNCLMQLKGNTTFFSQLGQFVWNTACQPYWTFGVNNQLLNLTNTALKTSLFSLLAKVYIATHYIRFEAQMMSEGDLSVANGMRLGNYTPQTFLSEAATYQQILFGLNYKAPGISQSAGSDWLSIIPNYHTQVSMGIFSFEPTIFMNSSLATIANLLDDNYTRGYLKRRLRVNSSFSYSNFSQPASLQRVRIVQGQGIDGITNTFAAAIWWIDFLVESALYGFIDVSIDASTRTGNYQSIFGPPPTFAPTSLYYGSILAILATQSTPRIIIPAMTVGTSSNIKVWGFQSTYFVKYLILNKDTNPLISGKVKIQARADIKTTMYCIYLQAPSLTAKADQMTIGGHSYIAGNFTPQGTYNRYPFNYDSSLQGFSVDIQYSQVALCQIPNANLVIPTKQCFEFSLSIFFVATLLLTIIF